MPVSPFACLTLPSCLFSRQNYTINLYQWNQLTSESLSMPGFWFWSHERIKEEEQFPGSSQEEKVTLIWTKWTKGLLLAMSSFSSFVQSTSLTGLTHWALPTVIGILQPKSSYLLLQCSQQNSTEDEHSHYNLWEITALHPNVM